MDLLHAFLSCRDRIVAGIEELLNAQRRPVQQLDDRALLLRQVEDCFFSLSLLTPEQARLRGQLRQVHWADGFKPRDMPGLNNDLVDPGEMARRGFQLWQWTRWPGRNGRVRYAQTLFNLYLLRCLEYLVMRVWDEPAVAHERLAQVQDVLDVLQRTSPADQPALVRDARWLIPLAQSPTTDELRAYFEVAERIETALPQADRVEIARASVQMAGGHLRSQLRHYAMQGRPLTDAGVVLMSRRSNALDFAMTVQWLVLLFEAYERAVRDDDLPRRLELASAICQGVSADPELFVSRIELLAPYSMIEPLFIAEVEGQSAYTPIGQRHLRLLREYAAWMERMAEPLLQDCARFRPVSGAYSPYGVVYGFSTNITEHMAVQALQPGPVTGFGIEDVFDDGGADKLAWVNRWRKLPHIKPEIQQLYDYPQQFAVELFERVERALRARVTGTGGDGIGAGRLFTPTQAEIDSGAVLVEVPELPSEYLVSSDAQLVATGRARAVDEAELLRDRQEGVYLLSYRTAAGWTAISKDVLTGFVATGQSARITGLPHAAAAVLERMCPEL